MARIHPTALVDPAAELAEDVTIGPYAIVGAQVVMGAGCTLGAHSIIEGPTSIGPNNDIRAHSVIGGAPQDKKYRGEPTRLEIGSGTTTTDIFTFTRSPLPAQGIHAVSYVDCQLCHDASV